MRRALAVALLSLAASQARADAIAVREVTATSERVGPDFREPGFQAFDGDEYPGVFSRWCTADRRSKGQAVTVVFAAPERIDAVQVLPASGYQRVVAVEIETDANKAILRPDANGNLMTKLGATISRLSVRFAEIDEQSGQPHGCLSDVGLYRGGQRLTLVHGVPSDAPAKLAAAVEAMDAAASRCDRAALEAIVSFPLEYTYVGPADSNVNGKYADAAAAARACSGGRGGLGRARRPLRTVTLAAPTRAAVKTQDPRRWIFAWTATGWRLVQIEGAAPVPH